MRIKRLLSWCSCSPRTRGNPFWTVQASNGVNFTEAGGRKAAHFAQVELKRLIAARAGTSTANPAPGTPGTEAATSAEGVASASVPSGPPKPKPVEGPVLPLTNPPLKAPGATLATGSIPLEGDPVVSRALRDGIAPPARPGRADEFNGLFDRGVGVGNRA
jgi:uncharacterized protein